MVNRQDNTQKTALMRRPSRKSSLGRISDLEPVEECPPTPVPFYGIDSGASSVSSQGISEYIISEDDDFYDFELLGLDASFTPDERSSTPSLHTRISHNSKPSLSRSSSSSRQDQEDYFFGTEPDQSPLTSSFPAPATPAYHLPYSLAHRSSRSASFSDAPSLEESRSFGTLSTHSSAPVTPLSPALAEIVDAVAKVAVTQSEARLSRQASMRSAYEQAMSDDPRPSGDSSTSDLYTNVSHFPLPPQDAHSHSKLPKIKTSLSNISEMESVRVPYSAVCSPGASSIASFDILGSSTSTGTSTGTSTRSVSRKSSYDMLTDRRSSATPVQQMSGTIARFLTSKRSISALEKEASKAHLKAEKLKLEIKGRGDRGRTRSLSDRDSPSLSIFSNLWSPKSPKSSRSEEKRRKKEAEKEKLREITEENKSRAETRTFENKVGVAQENWAVPIAAVGGL